MNITKQNDVTIIKIPYNEIEKIDFALCQQPKQTLNSYYNACQRKPEILINGGFFAMSTGATCFSYKDNGEIISKDSNLLNGFGIYNNKLEYGNFNNPKYKDFVSSYPTLIEQGNISKITLQTCIDYNARRSIIGYDLNNVYLFAVEGAGMTFEKMQKFLLPYNLDYAINLDGGGSTKILYKGKNITSSIYNRAVDNVIAFYLKNDIIYRVQTGAFLIKSNAEKQCAMIHQLNDEIEAGYKNAYVCKAGNYYKVQIGAFNKKENAQKVVKDLNRKGIQSFITT